MAVHWFFQFAVVKVTPNMFVSLNIWGAYVFWAMICFIGFVGIGISAPETKQIPIERMEELFSGRWWMGWKAKVDLSDTGADEFTAKQQREKALSSAEVEQV
jgi:hypothetical protein